MHNWHKNLTQSAKCSESGCKVSLKKKLPRNHWGRTKKLADESDEVVPIPVALDRVAVQVAPIGIAVEVEHITITHGATHQLYKIASAPPSFEYSRD